MPNTNCNLFKTHPGVTAPLDEVNCLESHRRASRSAVAQKRAILEHRREIKGGWSPRPEVLNK